MAVDKAQNVAQDILRTVISAHGISGRLKVTKAFLLTENHNEDKKDLVSILNPQINLQLKYLVGQIHGLEG